MSIIPALVESGLAIAGGIIGGNEAEAAAEAQANAIADASRISQKAAADARQSAVELFSPALADFTSGIQQSMDMLLSGQQSSLDVLNQTTQNASQILNQGSLNAQRAILGLPPETAFVGGSVQPITPQLPATQAAGQASTELVPTQPTAPQPEPLQFPDLGFGKQVADDRFNRQAAQQTGPFDFSGLDLSGIAGLGLEGFQAPTGIDKMPISAATAEQVLGPNAFRGEFMVGDRQAVFDENLAQQEAATQANLAGLTEPISAQLPGGLVPPVTTQIPTQTSVIPQTPQLPGIGTQAPLATAAMPNLTGTGMTGIGTARADLQQGLAGAMRSIGQGFGRLGAAEERALAALGGKLPGFGVGQFGGGRSLNVDTSAIDRAISAGIGELRGGERRGLAEIRRGTQAGVSELEQFASVGEQALQRQAALAGGLGAEAQAQALSEFQESPGQRFMRERQEQALLRSSAAIGGLGGGNVRTALQEQAAGIAAQQQQQQLENLRALALQGQQAAGQQASIQQGGGVAGGQLIGNLAGQAGGLRGQQAGIEGNIAATKIGQIGASNRMAAQLAAQQSSQAANLIAGFAGQGLGLTSQQIAAQLGTGQGLSGLAAQGGTQLANIISGNAAAQAGLASQLGTGAAGIQQQGAANLANLATQRATGQAGLRTDLAGMLSNLAVGQGTQQSNLALQQGQAQAAGTLGQSAAFQQGLAGVAGAAGNYYQNQQLQQLLGQQAAIPITPGFLR